MKKNIAVSIIFLGIFYCSPQISLAQATNNGTINNTPVSNGTINNTPTNNGAVTNSPTDNGTISNGCGGALCNPLKGISSLSDLVTAVLNAIVKTIAPIILTLALIYVGFLFVMAQGKEESISAAKSALFWTVIGGLILLGANAIMAVVQSTAGTL